MKLPQEYLVSGQFSNSQHKLLFVLEANMSLKIIFIQAFACSVNQA